MDEEKERKMYVVTQRVIRVAIVLADSLDEATEMADRKEWFAPPSEEVKTQSINDVTYLKSNEEVEKDGKVL